jgi:ABC-type sugar transport system substrate-binding protein
MQWGALVVAAAGAALLAGPASAAGGALLPSTRTRSTRARAGPRRRQAAAKDMGAGPVTHYAPTRPNNLAEQLSEIEDVTVKKPDAILFMAVDPRGVVPAIEKVNAAGIPLVNYNDRVRGGKFLSYVAADDYNLGLDAGRYLLKALGGKGNVVIIEGVKGATTRRSPPGSTRRSRKIRASNYSLPSRPTTSGFRHCR